MFDRQTDTCFRIQNNPKTRDLLRAQCRNLFRGIISTTAINQIIYGFKNFLHTFIKSVAFRLRV